MSLSAKKRRNLLGIGFIAFTLFVYYGLFSPLCEIGFNHFVTQENQLSKLLIIAVLGAFLFIACKNYKRFAMPKTALVLCMLCAVCIIFDLSFQRTSSWSGIFGTFEKFLFALWLWMSLVSVLFSALGLFSVCIKWLSNRDVKNSITQKERNFARVVWKRTALLLLLWLVHIVMQYPGHIETTAGQQIQQAFGTLPITKDNPIFHTLLLKFLIKGSTYIGLSDTAAVMVVSLSQVIPLTVVLAWSTTLVEQIGQSASYARALLLFYGICPLFPLYGMFIVKDVPFATEILAFTCIVIQMSISGDVFFGNRKSVVGFILCGLALCLMRNVAVMIYLVSGAMLLIQYRNNSKSQKFILFSLVVTIALYGCFNVAANAVFDIQTLESRQAENRSVQCQIIARVVKYHEEELSAAELEVIDAVIPLEELGTRYDPEVSDPVKDTWRSNVTKQQKSDLNALTLRFLLRYPSQSIQAFLQIAIPYITPGDIGRFRSLFDCGFSNIEEIYPYFKPKHLFSSTVFRSTLDYFQIQPLINFFCSSGFYAWMLLGSAVYCLKRRNAKRLIYFIPSALVLMGCFFSPVAGYVRYALPVMFTAPLLMSVAIAKRKKNCCEYNTQSI